MSAKLPTKHRLCGAVHKRQDACKACDKLRAQRKAHQLWHGEHNAAFFAWRDTCEALGSPITAERAATWENNYLKKYPEPPAPPKRKL